MALVIAISTFPSMNPVSASTDLGVQENTQEEAQKKVTSVKPDIRKTGTDMEKTNVTTEKKPDARVSDTASKKKSDTEKNSLKISPKPVKKKAVVRAAGLKNVVMDKGIWINNDQSTGYSTLKEAAENAKAGDIIHIKGDFSADTAVAKAVDIKKAITLELSGNTVLKGDGNSGITLSNGAKLKAGTNTLTMKGFKTALTIKAGSEVGDGHYILDGNEVGFSLEGNAKLEGTGRDKLVISARNSSGRGFTYASESRFIKCTVDVEVSNEKSEQYAGLYMKDAALTTKGVWYYFDPAKGLGGVHLDHSDFYAYKATGSSSYGQVMAILGTSELTNGSTLTGDGSRITLSAKMTVTDSKVVIKNSTVGGGNINYTPAEAVFENSTLETHNMKYTPSYGTGQSNGPCYLTFKGNCIVNTDAKDKTADNGGANRGTGSTYVVTGGSFLVAYQKNYNYNTTTPINGKENGDEFLTLFTLTDTSMKQLHPINKNGSTYVYNVANPSKDGAKHVWTPAAKVTFDLQNADAKKIVYHNGNGSSYIVSVGKEQNTSDILDFNAITEKEVAFSIPGKKFKYWTEDAQGKGKQLKAGDKVSFSDHTKQYDLYAQYEEDTYKVSFSANGGHFTTDSVFKTKTDIFDIVKDENGGEVAVLKKTAKYNDTLRSLLNGMDHNLLKPDEHAYRAGYLLKNKEYWSYTAASGSSDIRFDSYKITTEDIDSTFQATITVPKDIILPESVTSELTANPLFKVKSVVKDGNKVVVTMTLKKKYDKFIDLYWDVISVPDTLHLEIPNLTVSDKVSGGKNLTVTGEVSGTFRGEAVSESGTVKPFHFEWTAEQTSDGKDYVLREDETNKKIQLTIRTPEVLKFQESLPGDLLIGRETEHDEIYQVKRGQVLTYTGRLDVTPIKAKIKMLKEHYAGNADRIVTKGVTSTFTATLSLDHGLIIPENPKVTLTDNPLFAVKKVIKNGQKIEITMELKKTYARFSDLYKDVTAVLDKLDMNVEGITVDKNTEIGERRKAVGEVFGNFEGEAVSESGHTQRFQFRWKAEQTGDGKDFVLRKASSDKTIQFTLEVTGSKKPDSKTNKAPDKKPDPKPEDPDRYPHKKSDKKSNTRFIKKSERQNGRRTQKPATGDERQIPVYIAVLGMALAVFVFIINKKRQK